MESCASRRNGHRAVRKRAVTFCDVIDAADLLARLEEQRDNDDDA
jgi:hypothetical protein